ncbi:MAG: LacI family DNA-binding transcriptional regulator [Moraxellaceae bacterium]|nr:LacI family DNA-binding transcriptional regulator [Moraxellaceae bacterium]
MKSPPPQQAPHTGSASGTGRPRQADIARRAGVSPGTVSKVINGGSGISAALRERVLASMLELGFRPGEAHLKLGAIPREVNLVTFFQFLTLDGSYFHAEVIRAITAECARLGIRLETVLLDRDQPNDVSAYRQQLERSKADAHLAVGIDTTALLGPLRASGAPTVIVNGADPVAYLDNVSPAARRGSKLAAQHLLACGHREIVHVTHLFRPLIQQRLEGFRDALEEAGIPFDAQRHVINIDSQVFSSERAAAGIYARAKAGTLNATALHCVSDYTAFGAIQGLTRAGLRVPDDMSVVSFDDLPIAALCNPPLTAAGVDRAHLGRVAVRRLVERFQHPDEPTQSIEIGAHLSQRSSVKSRPASA